MVGVAGFEPTASTSQMWRATNCATPRYSLLLSFYSRAWRASGCHVSRCCGLGAALHRSHGCPALPPHCFRRWRRSAACTNCATPRYSLLLFFTAARGAFKPPLRAGRAAGFRPAQRLCAHGARGSACIVYYRQKTAARQAKCLTQRPCRRTIEHISKGKGGRNGTQRKENGKSDSPVQKQRLYLCGQ